MKEPLLVALSLAACLVAFGWAREHRLRRGLLSLLVRIFTKETKQ